MSAEVPEIVASGRTDSALFENGGGEGGAIGRMIASVGSAVSKVKVTSVGEGSRLPAWSVAIERTRYCLPET